MKKYVIGIVICMMVLLITEFMDPSIEPYIATRAYLTGCLTILTLRTVWKYRYL